MTIFWIRLLLLVFVIHLILFTRRFVKRRRGSDAIVSLTFLLLVLSYSCRLWAPTWMAFDLAIFSLLRYGAWCTAVLSLALLVRRRWPPKSDRRAEPLPAIDEEVDGGK